MGSLKLEQTLVVKAYKKPTVAGTAIIQHDFKIDPAENFASDDFNESDGTRYNLPNGTVDQVISLDTIALAKVLIIQPDQDIKVKITNADGETQNLKFKGGRTSVLHIEFTSIKLSNDSGAAATGRLFAMGD